MNLHKICPWAKITWYLQIITELGVNNITVCVHFFAKSTCLFNLFEICSHVFTKDGFMDVYHIDTTIGINKGLYVMLDAHSDLFATGSSDSDFTGFTGLIDSGGSYPLVLQNGFQIQGSIQILL